MAKHRATIDIEGYRKLGQQRWSKATPTTVDGIRFASKMEANVYVRLKSELKPGEKLILQPSFPLLVLEPDERGRVQRYTPDFVIFRGYPVIHSMRVIEAKGRESRDFKLRKQAFVATYGVQVEVVKE